QSNLLRMKEAAAKWRTQFADPAFRLLGAPATRDQGVAMVDSNLNATLFGEYRSARNAIETAERAIEKANDTAQRSAQDTGKLVLILGTLLTIAASAGVGLLLSRLLARPVTAMTDT